MQSDASTWQHNARRASYSTAAHTARRSSASSLNAASASPGNGNAGSSTIAVGPRSEESSAVDTWSSFLWEQWCVQKALTTCGSDDEATRAEVARKAESTARTCGPPPVGTLRKVDMLATLQTLIAAQNSEIVQVRQETLSTRRAENTAHTPSPPRSTPVADGAAAGNDSEASPHPSLSAHTERAELENTLSVSVLVELLEPCRDRWQSKLTARFIPSDAASGASNRPLPVEEGRRGGERETDAVPLPTSDELLDCLLEGLQTETTRRYVAVDLLGIPPADLTVGIDPRGLFASFEPPVQALTSMYTRFVPTLTQLRDVYFPDLNPAKIATAFTGSFLDSTLEVMEEQLDTLLRRGTSVEALSGILREGVHPSLRRLVYARALQLTLIATDGQPLFAPNGKDLFVNSTAPALPSYLSCGTKYARDKVRRRYHHYYSSATQAALVERLQASMAADNAQTTSNDERYFVFDEEIATIGAALVADKSLPDAKLKTALLQLGYDDDAFEAYITYLAHKEGDGMILKAPPCGFVPLAGTSRLLAPLGYVTGDTTEQYELASALFAQVWCRLQGPTPELVQCCWLFERLVTQLAPEATLHLTRVLRFPALRLALGWMSTGFADLLEPSELLLLWDLILSYHTREMLTRSPLARVVGLADADGLAEDAKVPRPSSSPAAAPAACALWILPLFAAALIVWRAPLLRACQTPEALRDLFASGHNIRARALLQQVLFLTGV